MKGLIVFQRKCDCLEGKGLLRVEVFRGEQEEVRDMVKELGMEGLGEGIGNLKGLGGVVGE
ncbi:hypothetical protein [Neisseria sicca]|uniref:hypothetical protein n=1 Tax=Neisseria sicca TaxID=490 RepID=UPI0011BD1CD2|nr:hypothetical protein [Neisseria sicca]